MSLRRLSSLLAVLLASLGLAALPSAATAQDDFVDEEIELVEEEEVLDEDLWCDDDDAVFEDEAELRQAEDEFIDEEDPDFLGPEGEDDFFGDDEPSDDELLDDCEDELSEDAADETGEVTATDVTKLVKKGLLTARLYVPGKAKIDSFLTQSGPRGGARAAKRVVLGSAHQRVTRAGKATIRIKLTPKGRKVLRKAKRALQLTLTAQIKLASGRKVTRTKRITVPRP